MTYRRQVIRFACRHCDGTLAPPPAVVGKVIVCRHCGGLNTVPDIEPVPVATAQSEPLHCPECGYVLLGLREHRCPECGASFDPDELRSRMAERDDLPGLFHLFLRVIVAVFVTLFALVIMALIAAVFAAPKV